MSKQFFITKTGFLSSLTTKNVFFITAGENPSKMRFWPLCLVSFFLLWCERMNTNTQRNSVSNKPSCNCYYIHLKRYSQQKVVTDLLVEFAEIFIFGKQKIKTQKEITIKILVIQLSNGWIHNWQHPHSCRNILCGVVGFLPHVYISEAEGDAGGGFTLGVSSSRNSALPRCGRTAPSHCRNSGDEPQCVKKFWEFVQTLFPFL